MPVGGDKKRTGGNVMVLKESNWRNGVAGLVGGGLDGKVGHGGSGDGWRCVGGIIAPWV